MRATGKRPSHQRKAAASFAISAGGPDFSIHDAPSSCVNRTTLSPDWPIGIGVLVMELTGKEYRLGSHRLHLLPLLRTHDQQPEHGDDLSKEYRLEIAE